MTLYVEQTQTFVVNNTEFKEKHRDLEELGHGCFGVVYKAKIHYGGREIVSRALKIICGKQETRSKREEIQRNIELCERKVCDNVVRFFDFHQYTHSDQTYGRADSSDSCLQFLCLQLELCTGGDLRSSAHWKTEYSNNHFRKGVMIGLLRGLQHIHSVGIWHGDLHPGNILFKSEEDSTVKITDFGYESGVNSKENKETFKKDIDDFIKAVVCYLFDIRESQGNSMKVNLEKRKATSNMVEVLVGLKSNKINIKESVVCLELEDTQNGVQSMTINTSNAVSDTRINIRERSMEEVLEVDPFYPKKNRDELLQPEDLIQFVIVYSKSNYTDVEKFRKYFQDIIGDSHGNMVKLFDCEDFSGDVLVSVQEIYNRAVFVLFFLTPEFDSDVFSAFISEEGIGQTKLDRKRILPKHKYSYLAREHKKDCRRPIHTMSQGNYETPVGLTTIKPIEYNTEIENQNEQVEKSLKDLGNTAKKRIEERKKAMFRCLHGESGIPFTSEISQTPDSSMSSLPSK